MVNYICLNNIIITILTTLLFVGCKPTEPMLELQLESSSTRRSIKISQLVKLLIFNREASGNKLASLIFCSFKCEIGYHSISDG